MKNNLSLSTSLKCNNPFRLIHSKQFLVVILLLPLSVLKIQAQLTTETESKKNFQVIVSNWSVNTDHDLGNNDETTLLVETTEDMNGKADWLMLWDGEPNQSLPGHCIDENTDPPFTNLSVISSVHSDIGTVGTASGTEFFDLEYQFWENDDAPRCTAESGDDGRQRGRGLYGATGSPNKWLERSLSATDRLGNSTVTSIKFQTAWRYHYGDNDQKPLDFGTLAINGAKAHTNSIKVTPNFTVLTNINTVNASPHLSYGDTYIQPGRDVWYKFTVPSSGVKVSITNTNPSAFTMYLLDQDRDLIGSSTNILDEYLCEGNYFVVVNAINNSTGEFNLKLSSKAIGYKDIGSISVGSSNICPESVIPMITGTDAVLDDNSTSPDSYQWQMQVGNADWEVISNETEANFNNQINLEIGSENVSFRRRALTCSTFSNWSNTITFTTIPSTVSPGSIRLYVDENPNDQQSGSYSIPPGIDPGKFYSTNMTDDGVGDPPADLNIAGSVEYIWQDSTISGSWSDLNAPCTSCEAYDPGVLSETHWYRRIAVNGCGKRQASNVIQIQVIGADGAFAGKVTTGLNGTGSPIEDVIITIVRDGTGVDGHNLVQDTYIDTTNSEGEYEIQGIYYGSTEADFTITPSKSDPPPGGAHIFSPTDRNFKLSATGIKQRLSVHFQDVSSFELSGQVFQTFGGNTCPMDTVSILLMTNGETVSTSSNGAYEIDIPYSGNHTLKPIFKGHTFDPIEQTLFIDQYTTGVDFQNTQTYKISGVYTDGCGNPIGSAKLSFISTDLCLKTGDGSSVPDITTGENGYYEIDLPANLYNIGFEAQDGGTYSREVVNNYFNNSPTVDLFGADQTVDFIYRPPLTMTINGLPEVSCLGNPLVDQTMKYTLNIEVYEGALGSCPLDTGVLIISDFVSDRGDSTIKVPISMGMASYVMIPGSPNITPDFTKNIQFVAKNLESDGSEGNNSVSQQLDLIVLGARARESTFATVTPQIPVMILRDPPGDLSYSHIQTAQTMVTSNRFYTRESTTNNSWATVSVGSKFSTGIGFITEFKVTAELTASLEASQSILNTEELLTSITSTSAFSTSDAENVIGEKGDVFIGAAMNLSYAAADIIKFDADNCRIIEDVNLVIASDGYLPSTTYVYTRDHIRVSVIPNLKLLADNSPNPDSSAYYLGQIKLWQQVLALNEELKEQATSYGTSHNYSFNGGAGGIAESTIARATQTRNVEFSLEIDAGVAAEAGIKVAGAGFSGGVMTNFRMETGESQTTTLTNEVEIGYVIDDDDINDVFSVDVFVDPVYQTPIFKTFGSETSCPYEAGSLPIDDPNIVIQNPVQTGLDANTTAVFTLNLFHNGQSENTNTDTRKYRLELNSGSNPDGAIVRIGGISQGSEEYDIPKDNPQQVTITIDKVPASQIFSYEGIEFLLYPACYSAASLADAAGQLASAKLSVFFNSPCSEVSIFEPNEDWLITQQDQNQLDVHIKDYDKQFLNQVILQYKMANNNSWNIGLVLSPEDLNNNSPSGSNIGTIVPWNIQNLEDGIYDIRLKLNCAEGSTFSERKRGTIDREGPSLFGTPTPLDGLFDPSLDEISATFTEDIQCGMLEVLLHNTNTGDLIPITLDCFENGITITPSINLSGLSAANYEVMVQNIKDPYGNLGESVSWTFVVGELETQPQIWYVDSAMITSGDGSSWSSAFQDIQEAINIAKTDDQIWIAKGTYKPNTIFDINSNGTLESREQMYYIARDIQLFGGFQGNESNLNDRDCELFPTILDGNLGSMATSVDNAFHVLCYDGSTGRKLTKNGILDGIIIMNGNSDGGYPHNTGGGIYLDGSGDTSQANLTIRNCQFKSNYGYLGGGIFCDGSEGGNSNPCIINSQFLENNSFQGGGIYNYGFNGTSSPTLIGVLMTKNSASNSGSAIFNNSQSGISSPKIINSTIAGHTSPVAAFVGYGPNHVEAQTEFLNTIFWNASDEFLNINSTQVTLNHSILDDGTSDGNVIYPTGVSDGGGNVDLQPQFVDMATGNYRLNSTSPGINIGLPDTSGLNLPIVDLDGQSRINGRIDMGAFENPITGCPKHLTFMNLNYGPLDGVYTAQQSITLGGGLEIGNLKNVTFNAPQVFLNESSTALGAQLTILQNGCLE